MKNLTPLVSKLKNWNDEIYAYRIEKSLKYNDFYVVEYKNGKIFAMTDGLDTLKKAFKKFEKMLSSGGTAVVTDSNEFMFVANNLRFDKILFSLTFL